MSSQAVVRNLKPLDKPVEIPTVREPVVWLWWIGRLQEIVISKGLNELTVCSDLGSIFQSLRLATVKFQEPNNVLV